MRRSLAPGAGGLSARSRIIGWMMLVVAIALVAELVIAARVLSERAGAELEQELAHEGDKLRDYAARAVDPATGRPYTDVSTLLASYLAVIVPDADETFFSLVDGRPDRRARTEPLVRLDTDPQFASRVAGVRQPETGTVDSDAGDVRYAVFPVRVEGDPEPGALVVAQFAEPGEDRVAATVRVLGAVSFVALALAGLASWQVAGRVLAPIRALRRTARAIRESDLDQRITVTGTDDVAALARTFNEMLDRLQSAQRDARPAAERLRRPAAVPRRRQPRAAHADHRDPRARRAARRRPGRTVADRRARAGRAGADEPHGRRPHAAGQG